MAEAKHTPGPWKAWQPRGDESVPVRTDGLGITIAYVHQGAITDAQANARLIAAAPELLEALKALFASYKALADSGDAGFWSIEDTPEGKKTLAAIAKAEPQP